MANLNNTTSENNYDPRWFIWTILFLVVTGISLVSYIVLSDNDADNVTGTVVTRTAGHKTVK